MKIDSRKVWVIMSKCRKYIAKGTPRNRELIEVNNVKDKKRFLTYATKGKAESAFKTSGFSTWQIKDFPYDNSYNADRSEYLEAVECEMSLNTL
jgi:hypothetical protein